MIIIGEMWKRKLEDFNKIQFSLVESRFFFFLIDSISLFPRNQACCLRNPRSDIFLIFIKRRIFQSSLRRDMVFLDLKVKYNT